MHCISISYKTTPLNIRELFAFSITEQIEFAKLIMADNPIEGCVIVSTCNRSELYFSGDKTTIPIVENKLAKFKNLDKSMIKKYYNIYSNDGAIRHLFRVTCGLDSMVLGEDEILRQVKEAYQLSLNNKCTNPELNIIFQGALSNAKRIKTDTKLSITPVSIGTIAANKICEYLSTMNGTNVLIVGVTGKMGSIVAKNLSSKNGIQVIGTSRSHNKSAALFSNYSNIQVVEYKDRYQYLIDADVIVSATTSPHYTFTYLEVLNVLGEKFYHKLFVDLAVPCDIDKDIVSIKGMDIIDIDEFEKNSKENNQTKLMEQEKAELLLEDYIQETLKNIYFQELQDSMGKIEETIEEKGIQYVLHRMKKTYTSEQFKLVLDSLQQIIREEQ